MKDNDHIREIDGDFTHELLKKKFISTHAIGLHI